VKLRWVESPNQAAVFTNNVMSQFTPSGEFIITFGQVLLPNTLGLSPAEINAIDHVDVLPVAKVALGADRMRDLIEVLRGNLGSYEQRVSIEDSKSEE
jgi:hypothetical protein